MEKTCATAVVFYSRSGHSRRLAKRLCEALNGTLLEVKAPAYESGMFGIPRAVFDSLMQRDMRGAHQFPSVAAYERVVVCGPVWTSYPAVPLRGFLHQQPKTPETVDLLLTCMDHASAEKAFKVAEADLGRPFKVSRCLVNTAEGSDEEERILAEFLDARQVAGTKLQMN